MNRYTITLLCVLGLGIKLQAQTVDTVADVVSADAVTVAMPTADTVWQWRDYHDTRKQLRTELREKRSGMRSEVRQMRDSVRHDAFGEIDAMPHEIRIGWGDMLFEGLLWHEKPTLGVLPEDYTAVYEEHYRYTQHYFVEYLYHMNYWYSLGGMVDYSGVLWDAVTRNGQGKEISRQEDRAFHNIVVMPVVHFSYYHSEYVSLYSALGLGVNINTGTELDYKGRRTAVAPAANISLIGVRVGKGHVYGSVELGGMIALNSTNEIYMLGARLCTASVGVRF